MNMIKCNTCKVERIEDEFKSKIGKILKTCKHCRQLRYQKSKCEHGKEKKNCKYCDGGSLCDHGRRRTECRDCGGGSFCIHDKIKRRCKECGGSQICQHQRRRSECKDCGGGSICDHQNRRSECKKCKDPIKLTIMNMLKQSKKRDIIYNIYDADHFIDRCFIEQLIFESTLCFYCKKEMQFIEYKEDLCTIERLNNDLGHIKSNCVLACRKCNFSRIGQR